MHENELSPHLGSFVVNVSWQRDYSFIISPSHSSASHLSPPAVSNISRQINMLVRGWGSACVSRDTWRWWVLAVFVYCTVVGLCRTSAVQHTFCVKWAVSFRKQWNYVKLFDSHYVEEEWSSLTLSTHDSFLGIVERSASHLEDCGKSRKVCLSHQTVTNCSGAVLGRPRRSTELQ